MAQTRSAAGGEAAMIRSADRDDYELRPSIPRILLLSAVAIALALGLVVGIAAIVLG